MAVALMCLGCILPFVALGFAPDDDPTRYGWLVAVSGFMLLAPAWVAMIVGPLADVIMRRRNGRP